MRRGNLARKSRLFFEHTPQCVTVNGISGEKIFVDDDDYMYYMSVVEEMARNAYVSIHAYVLDSQYVILLCTPEFKDSMARMMQGVGIKYVAYFNAKYGRKGTLWEGRYKSSFVEGRYVLSLMRYIESLGAARERRFNSFEDNTAEVLNAFIVPHEMYELLAPSAEDRKRLYKELSSEALDGALEDFIVQTLAKQAVLGTTTYIKELEERSGVALIGKSRGRPKNTKSKRNEMFKKVLPLDKEKHKELKVSPLLNLNFAKNLSSTPVLIHEASSVALNFPVVFTGEETPSLIALTSLGGQNLAINSEGKYIVKYIPMFLRKYPFALAATSEEDKDRKIVVIDEDSEVLSTTKGKQLFTQEGEEAEALKNAINFLNEYEKNLFHTTQMMQIIASKDILEEREFTVGDGEEKQVLLKGFKVVDREKLNALDDATLAEWVRRGIITFIDVHLNSLQHLQTIYNLAHARTASETTQG